jgi:hypothetical protein
VTDDPRLSFSVMSHELMVPHGSLMWAVSARRPSSHVLVFAWAGMSSSPVEVAYTEYNALTLTSNPSTYSLL